MRLPVMCMFCFAQAAWNIHYKVRVHVVMHIRHTDFRPVTVTTLTRKLNWEGWTKLTQYALTTFVVGHNKLTIGMDGHLLQDITDIVGYIPHHGVKLKDFHLKYKYVNT